MKKILKIIGFSLLGLVVLAAISIGVFVYKVQNGLPFYESTPPEIPAQKSFAVLVFSKTNGFRHGASINASIPAFQEIADNNGWSVFFTENGAVFNEEQLAQFDVVVWNNVTGRVLKDEQRAAFENYIETGGGFLGIHGSGDFSHPWEWYQEKLIGAAFSHHSLDPHIQEAPMHLEVDSSYLAMSSGLPSQWLHSEEWYVFFDNPRDKDFKVLYTVDESNLQLSGNLGFFVKDKDFGMGEDHPIIWYKEVGQGKAVYSGLGHTAECWSVTEHVQVIQHALRWAGGE